LFSVAPDGSRSGATCTATTVGDHTVTGAVDLGDGATASGTAVLHVLAGPLASLKLRPERLRRTRHTAQYFDPSAPPITQTDASWAVGKATAAVSGVKALLAGSPPERFG